MNKRLRINWFTPLAPLETDIAHYSVRIVEALSKLAEVTFWTDQEVWDKAIEAIAPVRRFASQRRPSTSEIQALNRADVNIYNLGNNPNFHMAIWDMARFYPGIAVLHDVRIHDFFLGYFLGNKGASHIYTDLMGQAYGPDAEDLAVRHTQDYSDDSIRQQLIKTYAMLEVALDGSLCAISHSGTATQMIEERMDIPTWHLPIPYKVGPEPQHRPYWTPESDRPLEVVQFGYIGLNRRLFENLTVMAQLPQRDRIRLTVCGDLFDPQGFDNLVRELGMQDQVTFEGFVPEERLDEVLYNADLALNMRNPTMGEASGSQLRIWNQALVALVSDAGWYAEMPEGTGLKVRPSFEAQDIRKHFDGIMDGSISLEKIGRAGRAHFAAVHDTRQFSEDLVAGLSDLGALIASHGARAVARRAAAATAHLYNDNHRDLGIKPILNGLTHLWGKDLLNDKMATTAEGE